VWLVGLGTTSTVLKFVTPPEISNVQVSQLTPAGAKLQGSVNANGAPTTGQFEYGLTSTYGNSTSPVNVGNGTLASMHEAILTLAPHSTYHFRLIATNAAGTTESADYTFASPNRVPIAGDDIVHALVVEGKITIAVASNDSDPDGDALSIATLADPLHGTAIVEGQAIVYVPGVGFDGNDEFTYSVSDGFGGTAAGKVTLQNSIPQVRKDVLHTPVFAQEFPIDLLANDTDADAEDQLIITTVSQGARGSVVSTGSAVIYRPAPEFDGNDTFTYTVSDGRGGVATGTVTLSNTQPVAGGDIFHMAAAAQITLDVLGNDGDADAGDTFAHPLG
jgi:hypothetical protein